MSKQSHYDTGLVYAPGVTPRVVEDCRYCDGIGCFGCNYKGYTSHLVSLDCDCDGCREFRCEGVEE